MLEFDDPLWKGLAGGYRAPYDPRPALTALMEGSAQAAWQELWRELHHQGDVGEASYAAVPHLVRIHAKRGIADWNTYALVATIDEARRDTRRSNPALPDWLESAYGSALAKLATIGLAEFPQATSAELVNAIIAVLAISKGQPLLGRIAVSLTEDERLEFLEVMGLL